MKKNCLSFVVLILAILFLDSCRSDKVEDTISEVTYKRTTNQAIVSHPAEADNLNPLLTTSAYSSIVLEHLFQPLETINPETVELIPILAKARPTIEELEENGTLKGIAYTFEIREEAVWPNGSPITAKDVEFSFKAILNPRVAAGHIRSNIDVIKDLIVFENEPKKVTIVVEGKYIRNENIAGNAFYIMPAYHYDAQNLLADFTVKDLIDPEKAEQLANSNPKLQQFADEFIQPNYAREVEGVVGSGAYQLKEFTTGQRLVLEKKTDWWGEKVKEDNVFFSNNVDQIIYQPIGDENGKATAIKDEQIDLLSEMTPDNYKSLQADENVAAVYDFFEAPRFVSGFWLINTKSPKLSDPKVRRALAHVVDVNSIIENVLNMPLTRISTIVLPSMPGYDPSLKPIEFDVEKAKQLLAEAGWEDSNNDGVVDKEIDGERVELSLEILTASSRATQQQAALLVKEDAIGAGINIEVLAQESAIQRQNFMSRNYELATSATLEPTPWAYDPYQMWHTSSDTPNGFNRVGFGNADTDALIEEIRVTLDDKKRMGLYKEFQKIIYEEQPMIFLYEVPNFLAIHKRFNAEVYPISPNYFPASFELEK